MKKAKRFSVFVTRLPCSCGGVLAGYKHQGEYDVSAELGLPALATGTMILLRCDRCGEMSMTGSMLDALVDSAALAVLGASRCLSGAEAKFLRKAALGLGQEELAKMLSLTRVTITRWEAEQSLSPSQDFDFRALVLGQLFKAARLGKRWKKHLPELRELTAILESARREPAPASPQPLLLAA